MNMGIAAASEGLAVFKFNPYHDRLGRFTTGAGSASVVGPPGGKLVSGRSEEIEGVRVRVSGKVLESNYNEATQTLRDLPEAYRGNVKEIVLIGRPGPTFTATSGETFSVGADWDREVGDYVFSLQMNLVGDPGVRDTQYVRQSLMKWVMLYTMLESATYSPRISVTKR